MYKFYLAYLSLGALQKASFSFSSSWEELPIDLRGNKKWSEWDTANTKELQ